MTPANSGDGPSRTQLAAAPEPAASGSEEQWLTPGVRAVGTASLLADLGHEIPTALLPSFLTSTLGAPAAALGLIEGVVDGLARPRVWSVYVDRSAREKWLRELERPQRLGPEA